MKDKEKLSIEVNGVESF